VVETDRGTIQGTVPTLFGGTKEYQKKIPVRTVLVAVEIRTGHHLNSSSECYRLSQRARYAYCHVAYESDINQTLQKKYLYNSAATAYSWANYLGIQKSLFNPCRNVPLLQTSAESYVLCTTSYVEFPSHILLCNKQVRIRSIQAMFHLDRGTPEQRFL
jgi:hypothetical protein